VISLLHNLRESAYIGSRRNAEWEYVFLAGFYRACLALVRTVSFAALLSPGKPCRTKLLLTKLAVKPYRPSPIGLEISFVDHHSAIGSHCQLIASVCRIWISTVCNGSDKHDCKFVPCQYVNTGWANKNRTFLNVDNFAMFSGRKACDMSKVC